MGNKTLMGDGTLTFKQRPPKIPPAIKDGIDRYVVAYGNDLQGVIGRDSIVNAVKSSGGAVAGTGAEKGDRSQGFSMRNLNAITPETEETTHYFWSQAHDFRIDEPWLTDLLYDNVHTAFMEDLDIVGAQQENIRTRPNAPRIDINHDSGGLQARRIIEALIAGEQTGGGLALVGE